MNFLVVCIGLSLSAFQSDMALALTGAILSLVLLDRLHDRQLVDLPTPSRPHFNP